MLGALAPARAYAADDDGKQKCDDAFDAKDYARALGCYAKAYENDKNPALAFNLARTYEAFNQPERALEYFEIFRRDASPELRSKVKNLDALIARTEARVTKVSIVASHDGAEVRIRGERVGTTPLREPLRASSGPATIELIHADFQPFSRNVLLPGGQSLVVDATLVPRAATSSAVVAPAASVATTPARDSAQAPTQGGVTSRWWFWTALGVVAVGATVTVIAVTHERSGDEGSLGSIRAGRAALQF